MFKNNLNDLKYNLLNLDASKLLGLLFLINFPQILLLAFYAPMQDDLDIKHTIAPLLDSFIQTNWIFNDIQFIANVTVFTLFGCKWDNIKNTCRIYKDITPVIEEVVEYSESQKDNSFLFHRIHNQTLIEKSKE